MDGQANFMVFLVWNSELESLKSLSLCARLNSLLNSGKMGKIKLYCIPRLKNYWKLPVSFKSISEMQEFVCKKIAGFTKVFLYLRTVLIMVIFLHEKRTYNIKQDTRSLKYLASFS